MAKQKLNILPRVTVSKTTRKPSRPSGPLYPFDALTRVGQTFLVENIPRDKVQSVRVQASKQGSARGVSYRVFSYPRCGKCGARPSKNFTAGVSGRHDLRSNSKCWNCDDGRLTRADVEVELNSMTR